MDKIRIIMLGGQDEQFKTMTAVEINNDIFVIEAGFKYPDKTKPGIDFIIPRYDYLVENKDKVRGYLSHMVMILLWELYLIFTKKFLLQFIALDQLEMPYADSACIIT